MSVITFQYIARSADPLKPPKFPLFPLMAEQRENVIQYNTRNTIHGFYSAMPLKDPVMFYNNGNMNIQSIM